LSDAVEAGRHLLVVHHSRTGTTAALRDAVLEGAATVGAAVSVRSLGAFDAAAEDVWWAEAIVLCTPANFGYMSGALKDFFERIYHLCLDRTAGLPYALVVKGDTDAAGAVTSVERIATGLRWRLVAEPVVVVGPAADTDRDAAWELGATVAASLEAGIL
jgi:multimeric flavodoxin WrbA